MRYSSFYETVTACEECDLLHRIPPLKEGERFKCERCGHVLLNVHEHASARILSAAGSALLMLVLALVFPFLGFSSNGAERSVTLFNVVTVLIQQDYLILSADCLFGAFGFPRSVSVCHFLFSLVFHSPYY